jgi:hypothetical protein
VFFVLKSIPMSCPDNSLKKLFTLRGITFNGADIMNGTTC